MEAFVRMGLFLKMKYAGVGTNDSTLNKVMLARGRRR